MNLDGFVKSPSAVLRFTFVVAAYDPSRPYSSGFARRVPRTARELFPWPSPGITFYEFINIVYFFSAQAGWVFSGTHSARERI
ncbi:MAG: hypothetical protein NTY64_00315 [Deltaproteobacteria bacterium]|nr:hypothetical protein [Deltaproteobacteria bacterium]